MASKTPAHPVWRITKIVAGVSCLVFGVVGLFLPILQGVLFLFVGLALLATENRQARELVEALKRRYPSLWNQAERLKSRLSGIGSRQRVEEPGEEESSDEGSSREAS